MKVHILYPFREGAWGGSNQLLRALREELRRLDRWSDSPREADIVLFDSFNVAADVIFCKRRFPDKPFVHRIDGPISSYRGKDRYVDELIHALNHAIGDGTIFQSQYSRRSNLALGMIPPERYDVILNAPHEVFRSGRRSEPDNRIRLVASSWSTNWNKGFDVFQYLDKNLDFSRYRMTFIGNSAVPFRNIEHIPSQEHAALAALLKKHDIYIMASRNECCSNALAEALASGLPSVTLASGGNAEVMGSGGELFNDCNDVIAAIDRVAANLGKYRESLPVRTMGDLAGDYLSFLETVCRSARPPRRISSLGTLRLLALLALARLRGKLDGLQARLRPVRKRDAAQHSESVVRTGARKAYRLFSGTLAVASSVLPRRRRLAVHYGGARVGDYGGPLVKVKRLSQHFPNHRLGFNLVYLLSNAPYLPAPALRLLKRRNIPIVLNQNGVFYPGWFAGDWKTPNRVMSEGYHLADWVFYQSEFCRRAAEQFLGPRSGPGEVLYNAVDTTMFRPLPDRAPNASFTFLVTGKIGDHLAYRLESTIEGLAKARADGLDAELVVAGMVSSGAKGKAQALAERHRIERHVRFTGPYRQEDAPAIYAAADAYVMTKYNDPCPNTVLEALACGLPVLYSNSGGVPELVGPDAGIGLDCGDEDWERPHVPSAEAIARGMALIAASAESYGLAARRRAVARFDLQHWIERHRAVFEQLLGSTP